MVFRYVTKVPAVRAGLFLLFPILAAVVFGPIFLPDPLAINVRNALDFPSGTHWLGTDMLGRDMLSRLCEGGKNSMVISAAALFGSIIIGVVGGMLAGWFGGLVDIVFERLVEILMSVPGIILALVLVMILGRGEFSIIVALTINGSVYIARVSRAQTKIMRDDGFIRAADILGLPKRRILFNHLLPNIIGPVIGFSIILLGNNILAESSLSFLGLGIEPPKPSWGAMLYEARSHFLSAPWLAVVPGMAIFLTVFAFNLLGDGLRQYLDPARESDKIRAGEIK